MKPSPEGFGSALPAVDTNILVRFLTRDDERQFAQAEALLAAGGTWVSKTVFLETEWVLREVYGYGRDALHDAFSSLLGLPGIHFEDELAIVKAMDLFRAGFDLADAFHVASRPAGAAFVTFDRRLISRAKRAAVADVFAPE